MESTRPIPVILSVLQLQELLKRQSNDRETSMPEILLVDVSSAARYQDAHISGAHHVNYEDLNLGTPPAAGLLPPLVNLIAVAERLGLKPGASTPHIVAYDSEGGGRSARLLWTLDAIGYPHWSWLNGGLKLWMSAGGMTVSGDAPHAIDLRLASDGDAQTGWAISSAVRATRADVQRALTEGNTCLLDCRSEAEYKGTDVRAARGGHIPRAVLSDWMDTISPQDQPALKDLNQLKEMFEHRGVHPNDNVIVYCQSHHRSSHTYVILKALGYSKLRGYDGSWSDWGNAEDTPIES